jgi:arylsulfatase A-like enzyme
VTNFPRRAFDLGRNVSVLLILLHLPITLLFSIKSRQLYETPGEIFKDTALLIVLYFLLAMALGAIVAALASLAGFVGERAARRTSASGLVIVFLIALSGLLPMSEKWWFFAGWVIRMKLGWAPGPNAPTYGFAAAFLLLAIVLARRGVVAVGEGIAGGLRNGGTLTLGIVVIATLIAGFTGYLHRRPFGWKSEPAVATAPSPAPPNVILITIDTLAKQDLSLYGYHLPTSPGLDALAKNASVFDRFYANSNYTTPTVTSILTGRYPSSHGVYHLYGRVRAEERGRTLAGELSRRGYVTAAVMSNPMGHPFNIGLYDDFDYIPAVPNSFPGHRLQSLLGFDRANLTSPLFDWWWTAFLYRVVPRVPIESVQHAVWYPPEKVMAGAREFLKGRGDKPVFLWAHFLPPHDPYMPPPPFRGQFLKTGEFDSLYEQYIGNLVMGPYRPDQQIYVDQLRARYDENIAFVDHEVAGFIDELRAQGLLDRSVLVITADHGESFEKGWRGHDGPLLHDPLVHVPLIVRLPGQTEGRRIAGNGEEVDLLPTILDAVGAPVPQWAEGESLLPLLKGAAASGKPKLAMSFELSSRFRPLALGTVSVLEGNDRLVRDLASGCEELYDVSDDPLEHRNRIADQGERAASLRTRIEAILGKKFAPGALDDKHPAKCGAATPSPS